MQIIKIILFPLSLCYGLITSIRNFLYNQGILDSEVFQVPVISAGNLTTGGSGKSPLVEYLVHLLESKIKLATLSRGYGRKTRGFKIVEESSPVDEVGDEPFLFKRKFPPVLVTIGEKRVTAIHHILKHFPEVSLILLDDAFQHRAVTPSLNILLMEFSGVFKTGYLLPAGNFREWKSGMKRADLIIVTKCPQVLSPIEQRRCEEKIKPKSNQKLFFSSIKYGEFISATGKEKSPMFTNEYYFSRKYSILVFTGIANPKPLCDFLEEHTGEVIHIKYKDHHSYSAEDLSVIKEKFDSIVNKNKIILTTEKDFVRLNGKDLRDILATIPVFYIPIEIKFFKNPSGSFDETILNHIQSFDPIPAYA